eukprot:6158334-Alexandrium_andersonii.AAC.1
MADAAPFAPSCQACRPMYGAGICAPGLVPRNAWRPLYPSNLKMPLLPLLRCRCLPVPLRLRMMIRE